jgi:beta-N-acetylhexosaminidase
LSGAKIIWPRLYRKVSFQMSSHARAVIFGLSGLVATQEEVAFFRDVKPIGYILFRRNIETPQQLKSLVSSLKAINQHDVFILIDQEGGRVRRLRPPHWPDYPPAIDYSHMSCEEDEHRSLVRLGARLMANDLYELGINVDCAPVLDVPQAGAHDIIGDRAYGDTQEEVAKLGRAACEGLLAGGVLPVIKHIPGHGRAAADSHTDLPIVEASLEALQTDFYPFRVNSDMPLAMTAHVLYPAIDKKHCATLSKKCLNYIRHEIGFDGVIMCDDLSMQALEGSLGARAKKTIKSGCDLLLHCNGNMDEMRAVAEEAPKLKGDALRRVRSAFGRLVKVPEPIDIEKAHEKLAQAMKLRPNAANRVDPTEVLTGQV